MKRIILLFLILTATVSGQKIEKIQVGQVEKNPQKAVLMSAILPGSGQFYSQSYSWGILYSALELAGISGAVYYNQAGNTKTSDYKSFADNHWDVIRWLDDYYGEYEQPWTNPAAEITHNVYLIIGLRRYTFTEFIETFKTWEDWQTYRDQIELEKEYHFYENISKYKQFKQGWDDWQEYKDDPDYQVIQRSSPHQEHYAGMRKDANDLLKRSTYFTSAIMFNHLVSAFDAYFRTTQWNKRIAHRVHMNMVPNLTYRNQGLTFHMQIDLAGL